MMSRKTLIAGNWKMNLNCNGAASLAGELNELVGKNDRVDVLVCPTYTSLSAVIDVLEDSNISVGAQNLHWEKSGAFTGEISAEMLLELGVSSVIIGHSERRQHFGETDATVNLRLKAALHAGLHPIVCVGETLDQRQANKTAAVISAQIKGALVDMTDADMARIVIAYEPIWAIGTGLTAAPGQAQEVHAQIRAQLNDMFGEVAETVRILYGGSVKADNAKELLGQTDIDGALVGGASLKAAEFAGIIAAG